jgi:hypothetical protein
MYHTNQYHMDSVNQLYKEPITDAFTACNQGIA